MGKHSTLHKPALCIMSESVQNSPHKRLLIFICRTAIIIIKKKVWLHWFIISIYYNTDAESKVYSLNSLIFYKEMDNCLELSNMSLKQDRVHLTFLRVLFCFVDVRGSKAGEEGRKRKTLKEWGQEPINKKKYEGSCDGDHT